ncbi:M48 family metallopeptidase [Salinarchaeum laminariae]|uniref:M48 family metallopeptidase n=1 Tax=Salinarchaeum laminariae TaxID=869888 RepID=UPI0020C014E1|nr:M48 family metallopeptidase [Salinarchaeum laminariae]
MLVAHVVLVGLVVGTTALYSALSILNVRYGGRAVRENADWLAEELGVDDHEEILGYQRARTGASLLQTWVSLTLLLGALYAGVFTAAVEFLADTGLDPILQGVVFVAGLLVAQRVVAAPFSAYSTFAIEANFGFNEQSPKLWLKDQLLGLAIGLVITLPLAGILFWLVETFATPIWVGAGWALVIGVGLLMQILYPRVIAPLFNEFEPLEDEDARAAIEDLFEQAGFSASGIYTMDASRRSTHLNAYFVGFGSTKRVVLFDTLLEELSTRELEGVLAHELAHWKFNHIWQRVGASALQMGVVFAAFGWLLGTDWLPELFGLPAEATYAHLLVAVLLVYPLLELTAPLLNQLSLAHEREADGYAVEQLGDAEPMAGALATLASENLANPFPHPWYAAFSQSHPPIPERMRLVRERAGDASDRDGDGDSGAGGPGTDAGDTDPAASD